MDNLIKNVFEERSKNKVFICLDEILNECLNGFKFLFVFYIRRVWNIKGYISNLKICLDCRVLMVLLI